VSDAAGRQEPSPMPGTSTHPQNPSFPRKRESSGRRRVAARSKLVTSPMDSRFRGNDEASVVPCPTQPDARNRHPCQELPPIPRTRHSRESGNPVGAAALSRVRNSLSHQWIPAFAGMTRPRLSRVRRSRTPGTVTHARNCHPSPEPAIPAQARIQWAPPRCRVLATRYPTNGFPLSRE
jgi:hypothetical protein